MSKKSIVWLVSAGVRIVFDELQLKNIGCVDDSGEAPQFAQTREKVISFTQALKKASLRRSKAADKEMRLALKACREGAGPHVDHDD